MHYVHAAHCDMLVSPSDWHVGKLLIMKWALLTHSDSCFISNPGTLHSNFLRCLLGDNTCLKICIVDGNIYCSAVYYPFWRSLFHWHLLSKSLVLFSSAHLNCGSVSWRVSCVTMRREIICEKLYFCVCYKNCSVI
jgi:hypothetical protein